MVERAAVGSGAVQVVIVGAGVTGLGAALAFARRGHQVTVLEWDRSEPPPDAGEAFDTWQRPGVGHFRLPHLFLALGRKILRDEYPDVLADLHAGGATDIDFRMKVPGGAGPEDDDLIGLACRRPFFETILRAAAAREPGVALRSGPRVEGLESIAGDPPRITGVRTGDGAVIPADLVVDASGRSTRIAQWLGTIGARPPAETAEACGVIYHCRYFRFREGHHLPTEQSLFGPRGELGNLTFATFPGERGVWALALTPDAADRDLRALRHEGPFMAAASAIAPIAPIVDPAASTPLGGIHTMGELQNVHRTLVSDGAPVALGVISIGDAHAHTDPSFGWGLSLGLASGAALAALAVEHAADPHALLLAFEERVGTEAAGRVRAGIATDRARSRRWSGEEPDTSTPDAEFATFLTSVLFPLAPTDPAIFRAVQRRLHLLDPVDALAQDRELLAHATALMAEREKTVSPPRPAVGPSRDELRALIRDASPAA